MRKIFKSQEGFAMVDVIVGMTIMVVAIVATVGVLCQSARATRVIPKSTIAANIAQTKFEQLKNDAKDWNKFLKTEDKTDSNLPNPDNPNDKYTMTVYKPALKTGIGDGKTVAEVAITVSWLDDKSVEKSRKYVAYYSKP